MSERFSRVKSGQPFRPSADWHNTGSQVFEEFLRTRNRGGQPPARADLLRPDVVKVRNNSGDNFPRFGVVGLDEPLFTVADSLDEFKRVTAFVSVTPVDPAHRGRFGILPAPIAAGAIGDAVVSGSFKALVDVVDVAHEYADVKDDDATQLQTDWGGSARILWKESGTGQKWAVVLLGAGDVGSGQYQGQNLTTVTQNVRGWDFQRTYQLPGF